MRIPSSPIANGTDQLLNFWQVSVRRNESKVVSAFVARSPVVTGTGKTMSAQ